MHRAHTQISLGVRIAQFSGYLAETPPVTIARGEDVVRCTWVLFQLDRTYSITRLVSPTLTHEYFQLRKPISGKELSLRAPRPTSNSNFLDDNDILPNEQDLAALLVRVYEVWDDAIRYVFQTTTKSTVNHPAM